MKKVTLLVSLLFVTFAVWADPVITGTSRITLSAAGEADEELNMLISESFSDGFDNTWDAAAANPGGIYVYSGGERWTTWASNGYTSGLKIGFATAVGKTSYTLTFGEFSGKTYTLYDYETGAIILVNGSTPAYHFTAEAGTTFNDRFALNLSIPGGNLVTCFTGKVLQITNNPLFGPIVVKYKKSGDQTVKFTYGTSEIDLSTTPFPSDVDDYVVEFGVGADKRSFKVTVER